ncbi:uncharacterized protein LOC122664208 [Telopea speciosissima]|uniref:uncharacterized protein LOC122664208 n=1 Tax=Telopea speciosissima TaxID=54955 RepID=UPI001CC7C634|nr:uncharacterized protein LOC122664208 [Telopea speciosissima]XP_043715866.1 uncharacterized protein LOC122664208 [Telopea speciosissima]
MDVPQEVDVFIKESIDYSLGLPVSEKTLELKLQASENAMKRLQDQYFYLHSQLKLKDEILESARAEASMNAQALKKFVEENQKLAVECANLMSQCSRWEKECSLYDRDREALMEFGNEADERAKEAEIRVIELEEELRNLAEEMDFYKHECKMRRDSETMLTEELELLRERVNELELASQCSSSKTESQMARSHISASMPADNGVNTISERHLLDSLVASLIDNDNTVANAHTFLEANSEVESCQTLLKIWECLRPSTKNVVSLAAEVSALKTDKEHLRINLHRAEEEVRVLFEENNILDEENKKLLRQCNRERNRHGSGGKHTNSASAKGNKRKSSPRMTSSFEGMLDFSGPDSPRPPFSPLHNNSPDSRMHKK